jgi:hypothetical protein
VFPRALAEIALVLPCGEISTSNKSRHSFPLAARDAQHPVAAAMLLPVCEDHADAVPRDRDRGVLVSPLRGLAATRG